MCMTNIQFLLLVLTCFRFKKRKWDSLGFNSLPEVTKNYVTYKLLLFGHRNLSRNTTQTAVINIFKICILLNLT